jgi:hypothetical protein
MQPLAQAAALFEAHLVLATPEHGIHIVGTDGGPDWQSYDGGVQLASIDDEDVGEPDDEWSKNDHRRMLADRKLEQPWRGVSEHATATANRPSLLRFHYRYVASELAEQAALLVHPRSQAYAALMCHAADTIHTIHSGRRDQVYSAFLRNGALMDDPPWSGFGVDCGQPNFERLRNPNWLPKTLAVRQREAHEAKWAQRWRFVHAAFVIAALAVGMIIARKVLQARTIGKAAAT